MISNIKYAIICLDDDPLILSSIGFQINKVVNPKFTLVDFYTDPHVALSSIDYLISEGIELIFVISDYQMPEMNGAEFIRAVKIKKESIKCIILSGHASQSQITNLQNDCLLDGFLSKPWDEGELIRLVLDVQSQVQLD